LRDHLPRPHQGRTGRVLADPDARLTHPPPPPLAGVFSSRKERPMDIYPTCEDCQRELIPHRLWRAADNGDRRQWQREGKTCANGVGTCVACYARRHRAAKSTHMPNESPIAPNRCTECETQMIRMRVWTKATREQRDEWRAN